jgi:hypothetical protein
LHVVFLSKPHTSVILSPAKSPALAKGDTMAHCSQLISVTHKS